MPIPYKRRKKLGKRTTRKGNYPDDDTLVEMINGTNMGLTAEMLGVARCTLFFYVTRYGLMDRLVCYWRRRYLARRRHARMLKRLQRLEKKAFENDRRRRSNGNLPLVEASTLDSTDSPLRQSEEHSDASRLD